MRILVSACLLGIPCRYDGGGKLHPRIGELLARHSCFPICPEQLGGLPTPRHPCEIRGDRVISIEGEDVTAQYRRGASIALVLAGKLNCQAAVLKERSPSCGVGSIHDGTFSGTMCAGNGLTAEALAAAGIPIYGESQLDALLGDGEGTGLFGEDTHE